MLLVELYINGDREKINRTRDILSQNLRVIRDNVAIVYAQPSQQVTIVPFIIPGKDVSLSKNLPDVLFKITGFTEGKKPPEAEQVRDQLLTACVHFETLTFKIGIVGNQVHCGESTHHAVAT